MQSILSVARMLIEREPRRAAEVILDFLGGVNFARSSGLYVVDEESNLTLLVGRSVSQAALEWAGETFTLYPDPLRAGDPVRGIRDTLLPVVSQGHLVGLVYLDAETVDVEGAREVMPLLAAAIAAAQLASTAPDTIAEYLAETPEPVIQRQQLLVLLNRYEWNLSRVARELRITRKTLYARLAAHGIKRIHVPKGYRRPGHLPPEPA